MVPLPDEGEKGTWSRSREGFIQKVSVYLFRNMVCAWLYVQCVEPRAVLGTCYKQRVCVCVWMGSSRSKPQDLSFSHAASHRRTTSFNIVQAACIPTMA